MFFAALGVVVSEPIMENVDDERPQGREAAGDDAKGGFHARPDEDVALCPADVGCFCQRDDGSDSDQRRYTDAERFG